MTTRHAITAGFVPLLDSALLVVAREMGFAEEQGIDLTLLRERSWASIRDRLAVRHVDVAHILGPMPIAGNLGLNVPAPEMIVPMSLGLGGNAVTVSPALWQRMAENGATTDLDARANGAALRKAIDAQAGAPLRFAVVHPYSGHNYELRYWLAASDIDPDRDIEIVVLPPPDMGDALAEGVIDGYCAGEPWNTFGVLRRGAHLATVKAAIWRSSPEKVLGVNAQWGRPTRRRWPPCSWRFIRRQFGAPARITTRHSRPFWQSLPMWGATPNCFFPPSKARCRSAAVRSGWSEISSFRMPRRRPSPGRAMPSGSTPRWCAGGKSSIRQSASVSPRKPTGRTSTAPH